MRRLTAWAVLIVLSLGLILTLGCQKAEQPAAEETGTTTTEAGTMTQQAGETAAGMADTAATPATEATEGMQKEAGEATGTN